MLTKDKINIGIFTTLLTLTAILSLANVYELVGWSLLFRVCIIFAIVAIVMFVFIASTGTIFHDEPQAHKAIILYFIILAVVAFLFYEDVPSWFSPFTGYGK